MGFDHSSTLTFGLYSMPAKFRRGMPRVAVSIYANDVIYYFTASILFGYFIFRKSPRNYWITLGASRPSLSRSEDLSDSRYSMSSHIASLFSKYLKVSNVLEIFALGVRAL